MSRVVGKEALVALLVISLFGGCQQVAGYGRAVPTGVGLEGDAGVLFDGSTLYEDAGVEDTTQHDDRGAPIDRGAADVGPPCALSLTPSNIALDLNALKSIYRQSCGSCALNEVIIYRYDRCASPDLELLVEELLGSIERQTRLAFSDGTVLALSQLSGQYNLGVVLPSIEAALGAAPTEAWMGVEEIPCPNCNQWLFYAMVHYVDADALVLIAGEEFWDG